MPKQFNLVLPVACLIFFSATIGGCSFASIGNSQSSQVLKLMNEKKYDEAINLCDQTLKSSPDNAAVLAYRGVAEARTGKYEAAEADLLKAISLDPNVAWYKIELANADIASGKSRDALSQLSEAQNLVSKPKDKAYVLATQAKAYQRLDQPEKCIVAATDSIAIDPKQLEVYLTRACAFLDTAEIGKSQDDADKSIELDNTYLEAYALRSRIFLHQGNLKKSTASAEKALAIKPGFWPAVEMLSAIALAQGNYKDALAQADKLIAELPKSPLGYSDKSLCLFAMNDLEQARSLADKALAIYGNAYNGLMSRILIAAREGDKAKVDDLLERMQKPFVGKSKVARVRAMAMLYLKDYKESIDNCNTLIQSKADPSAYRIRAEAYRRLHKKDLSDADMKKAISLGYTTIGVTEQYLKALDNDKSERKELAP